LNAQVGAQTCELLVGVDSRYPITLPVIMLIRAPSFPSMPHVEVDGFICTTTSNERFDRDQPVGLLEHLLGRALDILERGQTRANEGEFRDEFISYWNPTTEKREVVSLLDPCEPTRRVRAWRGAKLTLIAETGLQARNWLGNRGKKHVAASTISEALFMWLPQPMLPDEYPSDVEGVRAVSRMAGNGAAELLDGLLRRAATDITIVIGAQSQNGPCLAGVEIRRRRHFTGPKRSRQLRRRSASQELTFAEALRGIVTRLKVTRADPWWIHGRDHNPDLVGLRTSRVALVGCGSLGSPIARLLALAGVCELRLIDDQLLAWENVGRHVLGASAVDYGKAPMLAERLRADFPHSQFTGVQKRWQDATQLFDGCDLIISTLGSFDDEAELNRWQIDQGFPATVYGWVEPRACAAHAVLIASQSGCFACGFTDSGDPVSEMTRWPEEQLAREPACGAWFMPYGGDEITSAAVLVGDLALDYLTDRTEAGLHRMASVRSELLALAGGHWAEWWVAEAAGQDPGGRTRTAAWPARPSCPVCRGGGLS